MQERSLHACTEPSAYWLVDCPLCLQGSAGFSPQVVSKFWQTGFCDPRPGGVLAVCHHLSRLRCPCLSLVLSVWLIQVKGICFQVQLGLGCCRGHSQPFCHCIQRPEKYRSSLKGFPVSELLSGAGADPLVFCAGVDLQETELALGCGAALASGQTVPHAFLHSPLPGPCCSVSRATGQD